MDVFTFSLQQLEKIHKNRKDREREARFLRAKFHDWGISPQDKIVLSEKTVQTIITSHQVKPEESARLLVEWADKLGAIFKATKLSSSQIRDFFGEARRIQQEGFHNANARRRFILLLPKLEYAAARANAFGMDGLKDVLSYAIRCVQDDPQNFQRFVDFFEAILAYHKAYGGN